MKKKFSLLVLSALLLGSCGTSVVANDISTEVITYSTTEETTVTTESTTEETVYTEVTSDVDESDLVTTEPEPVEETTYTISDYVKQTAYSTNWESRDGIGSCGLDYKNWELQIPNGTGVDCLTYPELDDSYRSKYLSSYGEYLRFSLDAEDKGKTPGGSSVRDEITKIDNGHLENDSKFTLADNVTINYTFHLTTTNVDQLSFIVGQIEIYDDSVDEVTNGLLTGCRPVVKLEAKEGNWRLQIRKSLYNADQKDLASKDNLDYGTKGIDLNMKVEEYTDYHITMNSNNGRLKVYINDKSVLYSPEDGSEGWMYKQTYPDSDKNPGKIHHCYLPEDCECFFKTGIYYQLYDKDADNNYIIYPGFTEVFMKDISVIYA